VDEVSKIKAEDDAVIPYDFVGSYTPFSMSLLLAPEDDGVIRPIDFIGSSVRPEKVGFEALKAIKPEPEIGTVRLMDSVELVELGDRL
jgi:hypothetical protein